MYQVKGKRIFTVEEESRQRRRAQNISKLRLGTSELDTREMEQDEGNTIQSRVQD